MNAITTDTLTTYATDENQGRDPLPAHLAHLLRDGSQPYRDAVDSARQRQFIRLTAEADQSSLRLQALIDGDPDLPADLRRDIQHHIDTGAPELLIAAIQTGVDAEYRAIREERVNSIRARLRALPDAD